MAIQLLRGKAADISMSSLKVQPGQPLYVTDRNYLAINDDPAEKEVWKLEPIKVKELGGYFGETPTNPASTDNYYIKEDGSKNLQIYSAFKLTLATAGKRVKVTMDNTNIDVNFAYAHLTGTSITLTSTTLELKNGTTHVQGNLFVGESLYCKKSFLNSSKDSQDNNNVVVKLRLSGDKIAEYIVRCPTISIYDKNDSEQAGYKIRYVDVLPSEREPNSIYIVKEYTDTSNWV